MDSLSLSADARDAKTRLQEIVRLRSRGQLEAARTAGEALVRRFPDYHAAISTLAAINLELRDLPRALLHAARALMLAPDHVPTLLVLAGVYLASDALELAEEVLVKASHLAPQGPSVLVMLGDVHRRKDRFAQARDCFERAIALAPGDQAAAASLADCRARLGDLTGTASLLADILGRSPVPTEALTVAAELPQWRHATTLLELLDGTDIAPEDVRAQLLLGLARARGLEQAGRHQDAWEEVGRARQLVKAAREPAARERRAREAAVLAELKHDGPEPVEPADDGLISLLVVGPSRSGKSTVERLLGSLEDVQLGFENHIVEQAVARTAVEEGLPRTARLNQLPISLHQKFRRHYLESATALARGSRVLTNSHPIRGYDAARMVSSLPGVRLILMKRNVDDLIVRTLMHPRLTDIALDEASVRAHIAWYFETLDRLGEKFPSISIMTSYEDVIASPGEFRAAVAKLCGIRDGGAPLPELGDDRNCSAGYRAFLER